MNASRASRTSFVRATSTSGVVSFSPGSFGGKKTLLTMNSRGIPTGTSGSMVMVWNGAARQSLNGRSQM